MNRKKAKSKYFYKKIGIKYYIPAFILLLVGIFYFSPVNGIIANKLLTKGNFYFNGGAYDLGKATKYYKIAAFVDGKASYPHYQLARVYFLKADYKDGLVEIDRALVLNPENKRAFYIRGLIDGYAENLDAAADDFQKFIAWSPKEWAGYNDLAWVYYQKKDYQKAVEAAQKGLEIAPNNAWLLNGLGVSYTALGENDKGKEALDKAASLSKNLTAADWKRAYPGDDAAAAPWDLAQFKTNVNYNLKLASNPFASIGGKFQAACSSSTAGPSCDSSLQCNPVACDPDHNTDNYHGTGLPACANVTSNCSSNADCCWTTPQYDCTRATHYQSPAFCQCSWNSWFAACGSCCDAGWYTCPPKPNSAPTVTISNPPDNPSGSNPLDQPINFQATVKDTDNDNLNVDSTIACSGMSPNHMRPTQNVSGTSGGVSYSFTDQDFPSGSSCTWTVTASDGKNSPVSAVSHFKIKNTPVCSITCPDSVTLLPGEQNHDYDVNIAPGCSLSACNQASGSDKISVSKKGNQCEVSATADARYDSAVARAITNHSGISCDTQINVKPRGWIETNP